MMQDDYLFDRTGSDAELERLEDLLAVYRYTEDGPPKLPATREAGKSSRWKFSFSFAFAGACTAVVVVTLWIVAISRLSSRKRHLSSANRRSSFRSGRMSFLSRSFRSPTLPGDPARMVCGLYWYLSGRNQFAAERSGLGPICRRKPPRLLCLQKRKSKRTTS